MEKQIKDGTLNQKSLDKIKSDNANFLDLRQMVNNKSLVTVQTASKAPTGDEFEYTNNTAEAQYKAATAALKAYKADHPDEAVEMPQLNEFTDEVFRTDGYTAVDKDGNATVTLADGTGKTAAEPTSMSAAGAAEELYVHALLGQQGKPWQHETDSNGVRLPPGPKAPVNQRTVDVVNRTLDLYKR